jgi:hypothetical protein
MSASDAKPEHERPSADDERPAKRAMREYAYRTPWYFVVNELKDDGAAYIKYTPSDTPEAQRLVRFFHANAPVGVEVDDEDGANEDKMDASSSSSLPSEDSEEAATPGAGVRQILALVAEPLSRRKVRTTKIHHCKRFPLRFSRCARPLPSVYSYPLWRKHLSWKGTLRSVDVDVIDMLRKKDLAACGTFELEYQSEADQPSWGNTVNGNVRFFDASDRDRPMYHDEDKKKKDKGRKARGRHSSKRDESRSGSDSD